MASSYFLVISHASKYLLLCSAEEEKTHTGLEQMEGKYNSKYNRIFFLGGGQLSL